jgi:hypothetical protein
MARNRAARIPRPAAISAASRVAPDRQRHQIVDVIDRETAQLARAFHEDRIMDEQIEITGQKPKRCDGAGKHRDRLGIWIREHRSELRPRHTHVDAARCGPLHAQRLDARDQHGAAGRNGRLTTEVREHGRAVKIHDQDELLVCLRHFARAGPANGAAGDA